MAQSEKSIIPSKISIQTYNSAATESQNVDDFSSYKEDSAITNAEHRFEQTKQLIDLLM
jgi:hypothetical protein